VSFALLLYAEAPPLLIHPSLDPAYPILNLNGDPGLICRSTHKASRLPSFRAEHFPYSGPHPWLDCDDGPDQIAVRLARQEISAPEAETCRDWVANGYVVIENLFDSPPSTQFGKATNGRFMPAASSSRPSRQPKTIPGRAVI